MASPIPSISSSASRTSYASSPQYRRKELWSRKIVFAQLDSDSRHKFGPTLDVINDAIDGVLTLPASASEQEVLGQFEGMQEEQILLMKKALTLPKKARKCVDRNEARWMSRFWIRSVYDEMLEDDTLETSEDAKWDVDLASSIIQFRARELPTRPKPDLAFGLPVKTHMSDGVEASAGGESGEHIVEDDCFTETFLEALEASPYASLHPRPSPSGQPQLAYPFLIHEAKTEKGNQYFVENQLAKSITFALEQQAELCLASGAKRTERQPVFGLGSVGANITLYGGIMEDDSTIVIYCIMESFNLLFGPRACAFLLVLESIRKWAKESYAPFISTRLSHVQLPKKNS